MGKLERVPGKQNWVDNAGGLPKYIERIAVHLHEEKGYDIGRSIAVAVNACKRMCASGDLNFKGTQNVNAKSRSEACAAIAEWNEKRMKAKVKKGMKITLTDDEFDSIVAEFLGEDTSEYRGGGSEDIEKQFTIVSKNDEKMLVFGYASVGIDNEGNALIDKQGDVIDDPDEMERSAYNFVMHSRDGGEMHIRKGVSTLVESFVVTPEKLQAMSVVGELPEEVIKSFPQAAWWVGFKVNDRNVWEKVKKREYPMFSVHGKGVRKAIEEGGE